MKDSFWDLPWTGVSLQGQEHLYKSFLEWKERPLEILVFREYVPVESSSNTQGRLSVRTKKWYFLFANMGSSEIFKSQDCLRLRSLSGKEETPLLPAVHSKLCLKSSLYITWPTPGNRSLESGHYRHPQEGQKPLWG